MAERFDRLLAHWVGDGDLRGQWVRHLHERAPAPDEPRISRGPLFVGRTDAGTRVEILAAPDRGYDVRVDGEIERHEAVPWHLDPDLIEPIQVGEHVCHEIFRVSDDAVRALREFLLMPGTEPPWRWGRALIEDGLIDFDFALTPRGERRLTRRAGAPVRTEHLRFCVVAADATRARILVMESMDGELEPAISPLREVASVTTPERRARDAELFSDSRPGLRREAPQGPRHGVSDRREGYRREAARRFAELATREAAQVWRDYRATRLVLVGSPEMLGWLRRAVSRRNSRAPYSVRDLARDLTRLSVPALHDALAAAGLLPARGRLAKRRAPPPGAPI